MKSARFRSSAVGVAVALFAAPALTLPTVASADTPRVSAAAAEVGKRTLRPGDSGPAVRALQTLLREAGFKTDVDGNYGPSTKALVRAFQRAAHITITGNANTRTLARLKDAVTGRAAINRNGGYDADGSTRTPKHLGDRIPLKRGMSGRDVRILQDFLRRAGFRLGIDGEFGRATLRQVRAFQKAQQLDVDGVLDANDLAVLRGAVEGDGPTNAGASTLRTAPGARATVGADGLAVAPDSAPDAVKQIIAAGNEIATTPYVYGGGHGKWKDRGYDCSGSVSYALHGAGLLDESMPSGSFMSWGEPGPGQWVTIYSHKSHMYMVVAGLRFDTSGKSKSGSRWQADMRSSSGFTAVHPPGL